MILGGAASQQVGKTDAPCIVRALEPRTGDTRWEHTLEPRAAQCSVRGLTVRHGIGVITTRKTSFAPAPPVSGALLIAVLLPSLPDSTERWLMSVTRAVLRDGVVLATGDFAGRLGVAALEVRSRAIRARPASTMFVARIPTMRAR